MAKRKKPDKGGEITRAEIRKIRAEMARQKRQTTFLLVGSIVIIIAIGAVVAVNLLRNPQRDIKIGGYIETNDEIKIPVSDIDDGEIHYYRVDDVEFYVHKNPLGNIRTRISLCEPCAGKTFTLLQGGTIVDCDVCHTRWDSDSYKGIYPQPGENRVGGCEDYPPPPLPSTVENGYVVIQKSDLLV
jgi:hypothetical protein